MYLNPLTRLALLLAVPAGALSSSIAGEVTGPSSSQSPYVVGTQPNVLVKSILTVGDAVNYKPDGVTPYRLAGIPDGMGGFSNGDGTFTLVLNHELGGSSGVARGHGFKGAFISKWTIASDSLEVIKGEDLIQTAYTWNTAAQAYQPATAPFARFCSGDLAATSAFYDAASGAGYNGHIYLCGEENGFEGRAFAHFMDGNSYELPRLGKFSWENSVANPATGLKTVVAGTDDSTPGQVYVYVGTKTVSSDRIAASGFGNGSLYGIKLPAVAIESDATVIPAGGFDFTAVNLGDVSAKTGAVLDTESTAQGVTRFARPEDAAWDPSNPHDLYFLTTASFNGKSRLWRLHFVDPAQPELGGKAEVLVDSTSGPRMMDNMTVSKRGSVFIQEDVGNNAHIGKIWRYSIASGTLELVAQHDPNRFLLGGANYLTQDEESSGIIPADFIGDGWYLLDVQAHYSANDAELVEGGQILALKFAPGREK